MCVHLLSLKAVHACTACYCSEVIELAHYKILLSFGEEDSLLINLSIEVKGHMLSQSATVYL